RNGGPERGDELLVKAFFAREGSILRRKRLVLERLELGRNVALGVLQRLAPAIVVGHLLRVRVRDFDVEAMHAVVLDLEICNARASALTRFERDQEFAAVIVDGAKLIQLRIESAGDNAAVAHLRRR